ncbi:MAG TPA: histidine kinase [Steroidobacteraceae bacterium]|nr:histidine kinase [Steroidobacteraceae bacterium]
MTPYLSAKRPGWLILRSGAQLSRDTLFWLLQGVGWLLFGLMMLGYELIWQSPMPALVDDLALVATGLALTTGFRIFYRSRRRRRDSPAALLVMAIILCLLGSPAWYFGQTLLVQPLLPESMPRPQWLLSGLFLYYIFILATWNLLYFGTHGWMSLQLERRRAERAEAMAQSARLRALQSQLEPHFLFNTLNSISSLVAARQHEGAATMIALLSDFLRLTLKTGGTPEITVREEIGFVHQYLDIQKLRFGERLSFTVQVGPEALPAMVPTLLLQPLVENALKHGILPRAAGGRIVVTVQTQGERLLLRVEDDGPGLVRTPSMSPGVGLSNTATRLSELYGSHGTLYVGRSALGGAAVDIGVPLMFHATFPDQVSAEASEA